MSKSILLTVLFILSNLLVSAQKELINWEVTSIDNSSKFEIKISIVANEIKGNNWPGWILSYQMVDPVINTKVYDQNAFDLGSENLLVKQDSVWVVKFDLQKAVAGDVKLEVTLRNEHSGEANTKALTLGFKSPSAGDKVKMTVLGGRNDGFVRVKDSLMFTSDRDHVFIYRFKDAFRPAMPPFASSGSTSKSLDIDSVFRIPSNRRVHLGNRSALYMAMRDSMDDDGIAFRVFQDDFPKYRILDHLTTPLIYISTNEEYSSMGSSSDKKIEIEKFWLQFSRNSDKVSRMIKDYFGRVTYANKNFSSIKEGWKTDRGMIHIVFGSPVEVNEIYDKVQWSYFSKDKNKRLVFTFVKKETVLSDNHYVLSDRTEKYRVHWMDAVDEWRNLGNR